MPTCQQIKKQYKNIKKLTQEFDLEYQKAIGTKDLTKVKELKTRLEQAREELSNKLWVFEKLPQQELKERYDKDEESLVKAGILEKISNNEMGIVGIDNQEYVYPKIEVIAKQMMMDKEQLETKIEQGLIKIQITPIAQSLDKKIDVYRQVILKHHKEGRLLATKEKPSDPDEPLELNESEPVWLWDKYKNADVNNELVYYPKDFNQDKDIHKGKTKMELIEETKNTAFPGYIVILHENLPNIPRSGKGKTIGNRKQLEAGKKPKDYLKTINTEKQYKNEIGMTPDDQIIYAIQHLEQTNQVIDDYSGKGSASYQLGGYFPADGSVPDAYWSRVGHRVFLGGSVPGSSDSVYGLRSSVRVV